MRFDEWTPKQAQRLTQTITLEHDEAGHTVCLDALEDYITAQLAEQDYLSLFPRIAQHLDSCVTCSEAYALVYEARVAEALPPVVAPEPDLKFLQLSKAEQLQRKLTTAIERLAAHRFRFTLSQSLLDLLAPRPAAGLSFRSAASEAPLIDLTVDQVFADEIQIQLSVYQQPDAEDLATVRARLTIAGREWPDLADIPVTLTVGDAQRHAQTDPWGEAVFDAVPKAELAGLQLDVDVDDAPHTST